MQKQQIRNNYPTSINESLDTHRHKYRDLRKRV